MILILTSVRFRVGRFGMVNHILKATHQPVGIKVSRVGLWFASGLMEFSLHLVLLQSPTLAPSAFQCSLITMNGTRTQGKYYALLFSTMGRDLQHTNREEVVEVHQSG